MRRLIALGALATAALLTSQTNAKDRIDPGLARLGVGPMPCRWRTLQKQGFSDPIGKGVTLRFVGSVPGKTGRYYIYHWDFVNPETLHGRQSIIILKYRCRYIGQFTIIAPPIKIVGDTVFFNSENRRGNKLVFSNGVIPNKAWIDGEVNKFRK